MKIRHLIKAATACLLILIPLYIFPAQNNAIRVDMEGYRTNGNKYVMLVGNAATAFTIKTVSGGATVYSGNFSAAIADSASGDSVKTGDFSSLNTPGDYYVAVAGLGESYNFTISDTVYNNDLIALMRGYYGQRCGASVSLTHRGTTFTHGACHLNDGTYAGSTGLSGNKTVTGGWHDAGDYGKYALNSGITMGELLLAYEKYGVALKSLDFSLPYSGGAMPDYLVEAKYNLDWMLKMQHSTGGVFHKISNGFPQGIMPTADTATRYIFEISSCATGDFAAVMAIASRVYAPYDAAYSAACLTAAQNAWNYLAANPNIVPAGGFTDGSMGGIYGDPNDKDERLWAAVELFNTTGGAAYNTYVASHYTDRTLTLMPDVGDDWKELHPIAFISYIQSAQASVNTSVINAMKSSLQPIVNTFRSRIQNTNGYKFILEDGDYFWGSNSVALNRAIWLISASEIFGDASYKTAAEEVLHYITGRNAMNKSYLTYVGDVYTSSPHHQPSSSDGITAPWPGLLAGGPNQYYDSGPAPAKCYVDDSGNYTSNEVAINWMAAYAHVLAAFIPTPTPLPPTNTPTNTATSMCYPLVCTPTNTYTATNTLSPTQTPTFMARAVDVNRATSYTDTQGVLWQPDKAYTAYSGTDYGYVCSACGAAANNYSTQTITGTIDPTVYRTERWAGNGATNMEYRFDLPNGTYEVTLKFMEGYFSYANARKFDIQLEGATVESALDIFAEAGAQFKALDKVYVATVTDGVLNINFVKGASDYPLINAIRVTTYYPPTNTPTYTPSNTGTCTNTATASRTFTSTSTSVCWPYTCTSTSTSTFTNTQTSTNTPVPTPIRVNCGGPLVTTGGFTWAADYGFTGGTAADSGAIAISNTTDDVLYQTERYGNPSYAFNVPNGYYNITFKFAETYWTAAGDRVMSVAIEGTPVITNLDIYNSAVAPKADTAYDVTVNNVLITDGVINITSSATADVAKFCAIAIIPAGPPPSNTPTNTLVPSSTYTNTKTDTPTNTYTNTATVIPTNTNTNTQVPPTATDTGTNTNTATNTYTRTYTATYTETQTPVPPTSTNTHTQTATDTATRTFTATWTNSATQTNSNTPTVTNTPPPGSTFTHTFTSTNTFTVTYTYTSTYTQTQTQSNTATNTATNIPTNTHTSTNTATQTFSITYTPSNTITVGGPTLTFTNTFTNTVPPTFTHTYTRTFTVIPSNTPANTFTHTWTSSRTPTLIPSSTSTVVFTATYTYTPTVTIVPTATQITESEKFAITDTVVYPNPVDPDDGNGLIIMLTASKQIRTAGYRVYTTSFRLIREKSFQFGGGSQNRIITIPPDSLKGLANGSYYLQIVAESDKNEKAKAKARQITIIK